MKSEEFPKVARAWPLLLALLWLGVSRVGIAQGFKVIRQSTAVDNQPNTLIQNPGDGLFYGTSVGGGVGFGSVFKMDADGNISTIHSFAGPTGDGSFPHAGLFLNSDGLLYGATYSGGSADVGTVFQMDTTGGSYSFVSQPGNICATGGAAPWASLFKANDGNLYIPMTICGGPNNETGTIDRVSTSLAETEISGFDTFGSLVVPYGHVVQGADDKLYGTASGSYIPSGFLGGLYRTGLAGGAPEVLHTFDGTDGAHPIAPLLLADDGNFYGTTQFLYNPNYSATGTIFKLASDGTFSTVHFFNGSDGGVPQGGLIQASDGFLYGVTSGGGTANSGTIYRLDTAGNFTLLGSMADLGLGYAPITELLEASNGKLYGTTSYGLDGAAYGTIYTIDLTEKVDSITPNSGPAAGGTAVTIAGAGFVDGASVTIGGAPATGVGVPDSTHITATTPANTPGTLNHLKVILADPTVILLLNGWMADFLDVPTGDIFHDYVRKLLGNGITAGCGGGNYCRNSPVTRAQMAVFLLKAEHGSTYTPPACVGMFFDVPCPGQFTNWIEQLAAEGITGGCGGGNYCPGDPVLRQQMAVFLLKTEHGSSYVPPACAGVFDDVTCPSLFANWIEQLVVEAITAGCSASPPLYCPSSAVTRGQMAVFLTKVFSLS